MKKNFDLIRPLVKRNETKIVLLVMDGLGGLPSEEDGRTELEAAETPNLDRLAARSLCGLHLPVAAGITPGSGPAHLALFGYDPVEYQVGRGVLSALGIGFDLQAQDVAARGNFCSVDEDGRVTDRRAGRIPTEKNEELCRVLRENLELSGAELFIETVKEYRFLLVLRAGGLSGDLNDTDPQEKGRAPLPPRPLSRDESAARTATLVERFVKQAGEILSEQESANKVCLRGFSQRPHWPTVEEVYGVKGVAIAAYPMYRGVSRLLGMEILDAEDDLDQQIDLLESHWDDYDFFFVHAKQIDSAGEDGDFQRKLKLIEEVDQRIPRILDQSPDVLMVTGDHSTPSVMEYHGWHPVPVLLNSARCRPDGVEAFNERECLRGGLGPRLPAVELMPLALANALRLKKFGA